MNAAVLEAGGQVSTLNIHQRVHEVMKELAYVQTDKKVDGKYAVATHDQIIAHVRPLFVKHGIVMSVRQMGPGTVVDTGTTTSKGTPYIRFQALYEADFVNVDEPADKITEAAEAHALDEGDKAPGKAQTYATKAMVKKLLMLEIGESDEGRAPQEPGAATDAIKQPGEKKAEGEKKDAPARRKPANAVAASEGQVKFIRRKLEATKKTEAELCKHLGVEKLDGLSVDQANDALGWIAGKAA